MSDRSCKLWLEITNGEKRMYSLAPIQHQELGPEFIAGFKLRRLGPSESDRPVYLVRMRLDGSASCDCPASYWSQQKGDAAPCKHAAALLALGILPAQLLTMIQERTKQLDSAEERIRQLATSRDTEREAACRNADSLRSRIAQLESELHAARVSTSPKRRTRKAKAA